MLHPHPTLTDVLVEQGTVEREEGRGLAHFVTTFAFVTNIGRTWLKGAKPFLSLCQKINSAAHG